MQYSVKLTMLMKTQIGQALWRDAIHEEVTEADHANDDRSAYKWQHAPPRINYPHFAWPARRIVFQVGIN